eukprot:5474772-Pleurochrysis_carterae.AAC.1
MAIGWLWLRVRARAVRACACASQQIESTEPRVFQPVVAQMQVCSRGVQLAAGGEGIHKRWRGRLSPSERSGGGEPQCH